MLRVFNEKSEILDLSLGILPLSNISLNFSSVLLNAFSQESTEFPNNTPSCVLASNERAP